MVMDREKQRQRYIAGTEGAPPLPPPGGYRGARRQQGPAPAAPVAGGFAPAGGPAPGGGFAPGGVSTVTVEPKQPSSVFSRVVLGVSILFALVLLGTLVAGATDLLYGVTMLALQLVVAALVIAALVSPRGRLLGGIALIVALLFNVATVGGLSALQTSASGNYTGVKTEKQKHEEAYPGIKGQDPQAALDQQSLEDVRADAESLFAEIRTRITDEFGYEWVQVGDEDLRPERNGYGGESMLIEYTTAGWATTEPIQDYRRKLEVMQVIDDVVSQHGLYGLYAFNDPSVSGMDPSMIAKLYGSDDPRTQHTWESYTENYPDPMRFYANIYDLSQDPDGGFRQSREAQNARTGEPLEGLQLAVIASGVLSDADREEFQKKLQEYPGFF
ncbi:hypothetical protein [Streptomyces sp. AC495_CC817]|uniref:hypothetical protein n=1 Tax=Streptomyces sp. AC495_CC817 TaxID=2823900 RepID=UPI001C257C1F|nr:hypothetical protein [Streptomyces sp. AC495_CC817]